MGLIKKNKKVMLIGLDLADADLIDDWCKEGYLPTLESLRKQGIWQKIKTSAEYMHLSAWPTLHTGTLPGKHGMYHAYQIRAGEQEVHRTRADECAQPFFWKYLDDAGLRCIILDAFLNYPLADFNGIQINNWGTWTWFSDPGSVPGDLWKKIIRQIGAYPAPEHSKVLEIPEPFAFRQRLIDGAHLKADLSCWLMKEYDWDFFYLTFAEPHPAGHYLYHYMDPDFPSYSADQGEKFKHALRDVYAAVDSSIGKILKTIEDHTTILIASVDGLGPNYAGCHLVPDVLSALGYYRTSDENTPTDNTDGEHITSPKSLVKKIRDRIPYGLRRQISRYLPRHLQHQLSMKWAVSNIDWFGSKAYSIPNANEGYVRINKKGREPKGIVPQGSAYFDLCNELKEIFLETINPANGLNAVREVMCPHEKFDGARVDSLPDVIVTWNFDAKVLKSLSGRQFGRVDGSAAGYQTEPYYAGNHRPVAFFIARGPIIDKSIVLSDCHIVDIAPTILSLFDIEVPSHFDGSVLEGLQ